MSIFKQMEEAQLTLEEIQELIELLKGTLPKIKRQVDLKNRSALLAKNLRDNLAKEGSIEIPMEIGQPATDLEKGYNLLQSANLKLIKFKDSIVSEC